MLIRLLHPHPRRPPDSHGRQQRNQRPQSGWRYLPISMCARSQECG